MGIVKKFFEAKGRWEVDLFQATLQSLKAENLKKLVSPGDLGGSQSSSGGSGLTNDGYTGPTAGYTML